MRNGREILAIFVLFTVFAFATGWTLRSAGAAVEEQESVQQVQEETGAETGWAIPAAIAVSVGISCAAAGYAVGRVGSAAIGAISEKPELFGRSLIFVGLAEGIAIYGLLIGILLWTKI